MAQSMDDEESESDADSDVNIGEQFIDNVAQLSGSDTDSDISESLLSNPETNLIDDSEICESEASMYHTLNKRLHSTCRKNIFDGADDAHIEAFGSRDLHDVDYNRIRTACGQLDLFTKTYLVYMLGCPLHNIMRRLQSCNESDPILRALLWSEPNQQSGFCMFLQYCNIPFDGDHLKQLAYIKRLTDNASKLTTSSIKTLNSLRSNMESYFFEDFVDEYSDLKQAVDSFRRCVNLSEIYTFANELIEPQRLAREPQSVQLKTPPKADSRQSLEDFLKVMCTPSPPQPEPKRRKVNLNSIMTMPDIPLWTGDTVVDPEMLDRWKSNLTFKKNVTRLRAAAKRNRLATTDCVSVMKQFRETVTEIVRRVHCPVDIACLTAVDIVNLQFTSATASGSEDSAMSQSQSLLSQSVNDDSLQNDPDELSCFPSNDEISASVHSGLDDPRWVLLPLGWKVRDGCTMGIFQEFAALSANVKSCLLVIIGTANLLKFTDNITDFLKFNSVSHRSAKYGIYGVEQKSKTDYMGSPVTQILYVCLTLNRAKQLTDVISEILWFLKLHVVPLSHVMIETFNNNEHFGECYCDVDYFRLNSVDGGFIGPPNIKLRKQLKLSDIQSEEANKAFPIIYETFADRGVKTNHEAISLVTAVWNDPADTSDFKKALQALMTSATLTTQTVKLAIVWNEQLAKNKPVFLSTNKGWISYKLALQLFEEIQKVGKNTFLDMTLDISDWDDSVYGDHKWRGTLLQKHIWDSIERFRKEPTNLIRVLKENEISLAYFTGLYVSKLIMGGRRDKNVVFSGPKMCGKSITAAAIMALHQGTRISLESQTGRDFRVDEATNAPLVVLEDVQEKSLQFIESKLRSYLDGDTIVTNRKMEKMSVGRWGSTIITTNVAIDSDSDEETDEVRTTTFKRQRSGQKDLLFGRFCAIKFRKQLNTFLGSNVISEIQPDDVLKLLWRYALFPQCNALFSDAPRCAYMPCYLMNYGDHHPGCRLLADIHSSLEFNVKMQTHLRSGKMFESYDRFPEQYVGFLWNIDEASEIKNALLWHFQCASNNLALCRSDEKRAKLAKLSDEIERFMEKVWIPLCYLAHYLKGDYSKKKTCSWSHKHIVGHPLFSPWEDEFRPTIDEFPFCVDSEDYLTYLDLGGWVGQHNIVLYKQALLSDSPHDEWNSAKQQMISKLKTDLATYITLSKKKKLWTKRGHVRALDEQFKTKFEPFDVSFIRLLNRVVTDKHTFKKPGVFDRPSNFYD